MRILRETLERQMNTTNPVEYQLTKGQALVIAAPHGSGAITLARQIASRNGTYAEIDAWDLVSPFGLGKPLATEPDTLIVHDISAHDLASAKIRTMIANPMIVCNQKFQKPREVKTPNFIFCTCPIDPAHEILSDPRFRIMEIGEPVSREPAGPTESELLLAGLIDTIIGDLGIYRRQHGPEKATVYAQLLIRGRAAEHEIAKAELAHLKSSPARKTDTQPWHGTRPIR
jgi:hypothetical protein